MSVQTPPKYEVSRLYYFADLAYQCKQKWPKTKPFNNYSWIVELKQIPFIYLYLIKLHWHFTGISITSTTNSNNIINDCNQQLKYKLIYFRLVLVTIGSDWVVKIMIINVWHSMKLSMVLLTTFLRAKRYFCIICFLKRHLNFTWSAPKYNLQPYSIPIKPHTCVWSALSFSVYHSGTFVYYLQFDTDRLTDLIPWKICQQWQAQRYMLTQIPTLFVQGIQHAWHTKYVMSI